MKKKAFISIKNLTKKHEGNADPILNNLSLDIEEGEVFSLLGPSGCGKSTFLRILAGFERPDEGEIFIDGEDIISVPPHKRPVNMMFQSYALFPHMTVEQNIAFGLQQERLEKKDLNDRVLEALEMVGLTKISERYPHQISGGQQQRTALARSIIKRPKLLLLDEPLGSLDRQIREKTQIELIKIQDHLNMTFILVTHEQDEAMSLSDRIGVMNEGNIIQIGIPEEIYDKPKTKFVATFVGSINMLEGKVKAIKGDELVIYNEEIDAEFLVKCEEQYLEGQQVCLAIRPEELTICSNDPQHSQNMLIGDIIDIGFLGSEIFYHLQLKNEKIINVSVPCAARSKNDKLYIGKEAYITWHESDGVILTA